MTSHEYTHPKVVAIKATSPHRKTMIHPVVPRTDDAKAERPRASSPPPPR